jgi:hypothetical protein
VPAALAQTVAKIVENLPNVGDFAIPRGVECFPAIIRRAPVVTIDRERLGAHQAAASLVDLRRRSAMNASSADSS